VAIVIGEESAFLPEYPLQVFRLKPGKKVHARLLSNFCGGVLTHWQKGGAEYCDDNECPQALHKLKQQWKGYVAAEVYNQGQQLWYPVCLELTEKCEHDMRPHLQRGAIFLLEYTLAVKGDKSKLRAKHLETCTNPDWPPAFELLQCVQCLYRNFKTLHLGHPNPIPLPLMMNPTPGEVPASYNRAVLSDPAEGRRMLDQLKARAGGVFSNGHVKMQPGQDGGAG
jgi:hypothetical protein